MKRPALFVLLLVTILHSSLDAQFARLHRWAVVKHGETGTISVNLTVQEAIYSGGSSGVARTDEVVTVGVPLPDDATTGTTTTSQLTVSGASAGQFRALGHWPSGRIKWVLVDAVLSSLSAGATSTALTLTSSGGGGNFGGSDLATDNGSTITVATGTGGCTFTIKEANFNGFDIVTCGTGPTTVVATGTSAGLVVTGPAYDGSTTACGTCTTEFKSSNDGSSLISIEENGPVRAVVKATGSLKDGSGNAYMKFTVRMHFYKGKGHTKVVTSLQNADLGADSSFATAHKGFDAFEWRTTANISGTRSYRYGIDGGSEQTGSISGSDDTYLYSAASLFMEGNDWDNGGVVPYTTDSGWTLVLNGNTGSPVDTGTNAIAQAVAGYADIRDTNGVGMSIGVYQMAAYWPKSLEFASGGSDVRIGIWARQNSEAYYQAYGNYSTHDLYFNFHDSALSSPSNEFLKFQHYLVARAPYTHYNTTEVFGPHFRMADPTVEQAFYEDAKTAGVPSMSGYTAWPYLDETPHNASWPLQAFRAKAWGDTGGGNQSEFGWSQFFNFITRGMTGRYIDSMQWYRFVMDSAFYRSDGFSWVGQSGIDALGHPDRVSANSAEVTAENLRVIDQSHPHWYGLGDYYFLTGDEGAKDAMLDGVKDFYEQAGTYAVSGDLSTTRAVGMHLLGAARAAAFLADVGVSNTTILDNATDLYDLEVAPVLCPESDEAGSSCTFTPNPGIGHEDAQFGTSRQRGVHWAGGYVSNYCGDSVVYRMNDDFTNSLLAQGILELRDAKGSAWADYYEALDLAYGITRASLTENYHDAGAGEWDDNGFRGHVLVDVESATGGIVAGDCPPDDANYEVAVRATLWMLFYTQYLVDGGTADWSEKFTIAVQKLIAASGVGWPELGSYQLSTLAAILDNPGSTTLEDVTITGVTDNGGGSYTIQWTVPTGAESYRIKYSSKTIVPWLNFDEGTYVFGISSTANTPWFAATNVPTLPAPEAVGTTQSLTISTGLGTGLTSANFSVKAYALAPPTGITWTSQSTPGDAPGANGWSTMFFDTVSSKIWAFLIPSTTSNIWSMEVNYYEAAANDWTRRGGGAQAVGVCSSNPDGTSDVTPWPGNRHPYQNMALDTSRNKLHLVGGVCSGTDPDDHWTYDMTAQTWTQVSSNVATTLYVDNNMVYDPDTDALIYWGQNTGFNHRTWIYCLGSSVTGPQTTAGCSAVNTWTELTVTGAPTYNNGAYNVSYYDTARNSILAFTQNSAGTQRELWEYTVATKTWANRSPTSNPTGATPSTGESQVAYITSGAFAGYYIYHRGTTGPQVTYLYDPATNAYTSLQSGSGPAASAYLTWDPVAGKIVARMAQSQVIWHGVLD
jgi:hypothetical protein